MTSTGDAIINALQIGELTVKGEFLWGSNYTFLAEIVHENLTLQAVYKPTRGERPLWDFPAATLARREVAAYLISEALGWRLVPPTVYCRKGPIGPGSVQLFIEHDSEYHYFNFSDDDKKRLKPVVLFDILINNADRKGSHILIGPDDHLWLIDHGICFHVEDKLRTVVWDFAGEPIPSELCKEVSSLSSIIRAQNSLAKELRKFLNEEEVKAIAERGDRLIASGHFPNPHTSRRFQPWPPL
jgi:uncharacterized repeat protein (TIGR03843 family)